MKASFNNPIPVFALNMPSRIDRRESLYEQFADKEEFKLYLCKPFEEEYVPTLSLWKSFVEIIKIAKQKSLPFFIFCEDDHIFTKEYNKAYLETCIRESLSLKAELLSGGMSFMQDCIQISNNLFWVNKFNGMQFSIIFQNLYDRILELDKARKGNALDIVISLNSDHIYTMSRTISMQKEFGYSDVTPPNAKKGTINRAFTISQNQLTIISKVNEFYRRLTDSISYNRTRYSEDLSIPVYAINLPQRADRFSHIKRVFEKRNEFDLKIVPAVKTKRGADGLWRTIQQIVTSAIYDNDDLIIICEDDHIFTENYDVEEFLNKVSLSAKYGCELLLGGVCNFHEAVRIIDGLYWTDWFWGTQFMVVFRKAFVKIQSAQFDETRDVADEFLSRIITNKMIMYPFISIQREFGYSDINKKNEQEGFISQMFNETEKRLEIHKKILSRSNEESSLIY